MSRFVSWLSFHTALVDRIGQVRAITIFSEQTGHSVDSISMWRRKDKVPQAAFDQIVLLDPEACDRQRFKGYHLNRFFDRVVEMSNTKPRPTIKEISATLSREFNRKITEGAVKAARFRQKERIAGYRSRPKPEHRDSG